MSPIDNYSVTMLQYFTDLELERRLKKFQKI